MRNLSKTLPLSIGLLFCCFFTSNLWSQNRIYNAVDDYHTMGFSDAVSQISPFGNDSNGSNGNNRSFYDSDTSSATIIQNPKNGTVKKRGYVFEYRYSKNGNRFDTIKYSLCNSLGQCDTASIFITILQPPVTQDDYDSVRNGSYKTIYLFKNDYYVESLQPIPNNSNRGLSIIKQSKHGYIDVNVSYDYTLFHSDGSFIGKDTITYQYCNNNGCDTANIYLTIFNDPPVAINYEYVYALSGIKSIGNLKIDYDSNWRDKHSFTVITSNKMALTLNSDGSYVYKSSDDYVGRDTVTYKVCDNYNACDTAIIVFDVHPKVKYFLAINDTFSACSGCTRLYYPYVNDIDPATGIQATFGAYSIKLLDSTKHGKIVLDEQIFNITYQSDADFVGIDSVHYIEFDDYLGFYDTATIFFIVKKDRSPQANNDYETTNFHTLLRGDVSDNDDDPEDNIDYSSYSVVNLPKYGDFEFTGRYGRFTYMPNSIFSGKDTIAYSVCDESVPTLCDTGLLVVTVLANQPPLTGEKHIYAAYLENISTNLYSRFLMIDPENDLNLNSFKLVKAPKYCDFHLDSTGNYTAFFKTQNVKDTVIYSICDNGGLCTEGYIFIKVESNRAPQLYDKNYSMSKNFELKGYLYLSDTESNLDSNALQLLKPAQQGSLKWVMNKANYEINFTYKPHTNFIGIDTIHYKVCDTEGLCDSAYLIIDVKDNVPPTAVDDIIQMESNYSVQGDAQNNDFDIDYNLDPQSFRIVRYPKQGQFSMSWTGSFQLYLNNILESPDTVSYQVCDNLGLCDTAKIIFRPKGYSDNSTGTIATNKEIITIVNTATNVSVFYNMPKYGKIIQHSSNGGTCELGSNISIVKATEHGTASGINEGLNTYTPNTDFVGNDTLKILVVYYLNNSLCSNEQGFLIDTLTYIFIVGDYPNLRVVNIKTYKNMPFKSSNIKKPSGNTMIAIIGNIPDYGTATLDTNITLTYTPHRDFVGTDYVRIIVCSNSGCDTTIFYISVIESISKAPEANDDNVTLAKNTSVTVNFLFNDSDNGSPILHSDIMYLERGTATMNSNNTLTYTPPKDFVGTDRLDYRICNTIFCDTASIYFTITNVIDNPIKHAPVAINDYFITDENIPLSNTVASNDFDEDNDLKINSFKVLKTTKNGVLILKEEGSFLYTPEQNFVGSDTASYTVCDTTGLCDTAWIFIDVAKAYHHPTLGMDSFTNTFNTPLKGSVALNDSDVDNDLNKTSYTIAALPKKGSIKMGSDGQFLYLPPYNFVGKDTFYYEACDLRNLCSTAMCIITTQASYITGKIYIDENGDGIQNANEQVLPNAQIRINNRTEVVTNASGDYQILVDTSKNYILTPSYNTSVYTFNPLSKTVVTGKNFDQRIDNQDFMLRPIKTVSDLVVSVEQGNARPGFVSISTLTFTNKGTSTISGTLNLKIDNYLTYATANVEPTIINDKALTWHFADLKPFESRNINISLKTAVISPFNYSTKIDYNGLLATGVDIDTSNNKGVSSMQVRGSFDPNDISVDVTEVKQTGTIKESVIPLIYTIRFQNTGNAEAYRVEVIDTLSEKLDISSLEMLSASHPFEMKIVSDSSNQTVVKWIFDNINLVDSTTKEACSHGFIKYRINNFKAKTNYSKDSILNKAAIYFDFNEPVLTNIASTLFTFSTPIREINNLSFQVYPNPTSDWVNITCEKNVEAVIELSNLYGQIIQRQILRGTSGQVNLADLQNGIYILTIKNGQKQGAVKILKQ